MHKDHLPEICEHCYGRLDLESREHTRADLGPWFLRNVDRPFSPGMRYETLVRQMGLGRIRSTDVVRGPTTGQFWTVARKVPGLSHHFGLCHACQAPASPEDDACRACGASFQVMLDRNRMGLDIDSGQASAFADTSNVCPIPQHTASQLKHAASDSTLIIEESSSPSSSQLRREWLAARRRKNSLRWLVGALVLGILALVVLQELKSPVPVSPEPPEPPASAAVPNPSKMTSEAPPAPVFEFAENLIQASGTSPQEPPSAPDRVASAQDDQWSLDEALRVYRRAVDASRNTQTRQAELGVLEAELVSLVASASAEQKTKWKTLENLVRQAIMDLQAELRLVPEASRATFPNSS